MEDSFLLGAVGGCSGVRAALKVSFWEWVDVEAAAAAVVVMVGRSRGAGTGGTAAAAGAGVAAGTEARGWVPFARLPVRMLQRLSEELLRPDWLLASLPWSCWSRYVSWADSVLLCSVTEMRGFEVVRGGTGGGAFLLLTADRREDDRRGTTWVRKSPESKFKDSLHHLERKETQQRCWIKTSRCKHEAINRAALHFVSTAALTDLCLKVAAFPFCVPLVVFHWRQLVSGDLPSQPFSSEAPWQLWLLCSAEEGVKNTSMPVWASLTGRSLICWAGRDIYRSTRPFTCFYINVGTYSFTQVKESISAAYLQ